MKPLTKNSKVVFVAVLMIALLGCFSVLLSSALTPVASLEPENGTIAGAATKVADSTASGGSAVRFMANQSSRAKLIKIGYDIPSPAQVNTNKAWIDSLPFDGIAVSLPTLESGTLSSTTHSITEYQNAIAGMPTMNHTKHNFVRLLFYQSTYDWYNNSHWSTMATNIGNLARAIATSGKFEGILIDPEYYGSGGNPWNYGTGTTPWTYSATGGATPGHQPNDAIQTLHGRGKQLMDAVIANWSTAKVLVLHGPYVSEPKTAQAWPSSFYNDIAWANELLGPFEVGMVESAVGTSASFYDGGEVYGARSASDFLKVYNWQKTGLADSGSVYIPSNMVSSYKSTIKASVGVYDNDFLKSGFPLLSASTWQNLLTLAMKQADDYVWAYTESYDWLRTGWPTTTVPQSYIDATAAAVSAADN